MRLFGFQCGRKRREVDAASGVGGTGPAAGGWLAAPAAVPADCRVYAVGDIHGRADLLSLLLVAIATDAGVGPEVRRRVIVFLGDYVDRGPDSAAVIDLVRQGLPGFESIALIGNHEWLMRRFLESPMAGPVWLANGGMATLSSYGVAIDPGGALDLAERLLRLRTDLAVAVPESHRAFLSGLLTSHVEGGYLFVHAGVRPGVPLADQCQEDALWIRSPFLASEETFDRVVVHGHTISERPEVRPNRIGLDTGAYATGRLTALVLQGGAMRFLST